VATEEKRKESRVVSMNNEENELVEKHQEVIGTLKIVGIDPSLTGTGIAILPSHDIYTIKSKQRGAKRLIEIRDAIQKIITDASLVVIENYAYCRANQAHQIGELGGIIRVLLAESGVKWITVAPAQLKKFATGKGNTKKEHILQQVYKRWGVECRTSDEADAFTLAKIGQALVQGVELTKFQEEVIKKLKGE
jgi:crossover junction endodeoxyribonuclease RuvC